MLRPLATPSVVTIWQQSQMMPSTRPVTVAGVIDIGMPLITSRAGMTRSIRRNTHSRVAPSARCWPLTAGSGRLGRDRVHPHRLVGGALDLGAVGGGLGQRPLLLPRLHGLLPVPL